MLTVRKVGVTVGDLKMALRVARYLLEEKEGPRALRRGDGGDEGEQRASSMWLGSERALAQIGVVRGAESHDSEVAIVVQGLHARSGVQVRRPGVRDANRPNRSKQEETAEEQAEGTVVLERRVNNYDLTFSAPKSVSAVYALAPDWMRAQLEQAMMVASNRMLEYMTGTLPVLQNKKEREPATGFAATVSLHVMSRLAAGEEVPSPQLHAHALLVGVLDKEGNLKTPAGDVLFKRDAPLAGGALARLVLAEELRRMGFEIEWNTGKGGRYFEIKGVPQTLIERWSARSKEVEQEAERRALAKGGPLDGHEVAEIALQTRAPKGAHAEADVQAVWDEVGRSGRFAEQEIMGLLRPGVDVGDPGELKALARKEILARIWNEGPCISRAMLDAIAFETAVMGLSVEEASEVLAELRAAGELIALDGGRVTSRAIRSRERFVVEAASGALATELGGASALARSETLSAEAVTRGQEVAQRKLGADKPLDEEQIDAVRELTRGAQWATLTGYAGTGKGPVLHAVAEAHRADGFEVIACAVDGATDQRLGEQIDAQAYTLEQVMNGVRTGRIRIHSNTLVIVEEASKVGLQHWAKLAAISRRTGCRVLAVGHTGQLGAIELPGMFAELLELDGVAHAKLENIRRHRDPSDPVNKEHPWLKDYQLLLDAGELKKAEAALAILQENDAIAMHETRAEAMAALVAHWNQRRKLYRDPRDAILVVHGPNEDVDQVNELAQACRLEANELKGEGVLAADRGYRIYAGDVVMLRAGPYRPPWDDQGQDPERVENGTIGIVREVDASTGTLLVWFKEPGRERGRVVQLTREELQDQGSALRLAYAFHPFPLQGATCKDVGVLDGHWSQYKEATYTADTRAQLHLYKHVDRESLGTDNTLQECWQLLAKRWATSSNRCSSLRYKQVDGSVELTLPETDRAPELDRHDPGGETLAAKRLDDLDVGPAQIELRVSDPLADYHGTLGKRRTEWIDHHARRLQREIEKLDLKALIEQAKDYGVVWGVLDRSAARRVQVMEAELRRIRAHQPMRERRRPPTKSAMEAGRQHRGDTHALQRLFEENAQLNADGRHPDQWLKVHGRQAARWVAIVREIDFRHELANRAIQQWSLADPGRPLIDLLGPPPTKQAPERPEWEDIVKELEHHRLNSTDSQDQQHWRRTVPTDLRRRIQRYQHQQGIETTPMLTREATAPEIE